MENAKEKVSVFCQNSSLRGVNKIIKSPTMLLRIIWLGYVLLMVFMLFYSVGKILSEYLAYDTTVQTSMKLDDRANFPAITVCSHYPFSTEAMRKWRNKDIQSPTEFNRNLRRITKGLILDGDLPGASSIYSQDKLSTYYQNLTVQESIALSHQPERLFRYCITNMLDNSIHYSFDPEECWLDVAHFSHPRYFNCYVIQGMKDEDTISKIKSMSLIVSLDGIGLPGNSEYEEAFTQDVFDQPVSQASGIRVAVHEADTRPDIETKGFHVEPGRMVEIIYSTVESEEVNSPKSGCLKDTKLLTINDLEDTFTYTKETCSYAKVNEYIAAKCKCIYAFYARPKIPNSQFPYCGQLDDKNITDYFRRVKCVSKIPIKELRQEFEKSTCISRCQTFHYETHLSSTLWRPTEWQLYWSLETGRAFVDANYYRNDSEYKDAYDEAMAKVLKFLNADKLRGKQQKSFSLANNTYVYITLKRGSQDTEFRLEKLQLSTNAMFSRVGGLCSLYLGLTCAFFIEIIEFFYLAKQQRKELAAAQAAEDAANAEMMSTRLMSTESQNQDEQSDLDKNTSLSLIENNQVQNSNV